MSQRMASRSLTPRLLGVPAVIAVMVLGLWITGGKVTNDFTLAMILTAAWMGVLGVACLLIALRWRSFALPVLGTYLVAAAAVGIYLGMSVLMPKEANDQVATAPPPAESTGSAPTARARPVNVLLASSSFEPVRHAARGTARAIRLAGGGRVLTLTGFEVDSGPDLRLYLVAGPATAEGQVTDFVDLGALKGSRGDQQYRLPARLDLDRYRTVVVWCRAFSVLFARAPLTER